MPPTPRRPRTSAKKAGKKAAAGAAPVAMDADAPQPPLTPSVFRPGLDAVAEGEVLDYDPSAYDCLHSFGLEWPCLR